MFRCMLLTLMGQVYRQVGSTAEAEKSLRQALRIGEQLGYNLGYYVAQANLAWIMNIRGQRRQALAFSQQALARCVDERGRELPLALFIYLPLAGIYYDGGQIAEARRCLERGFVASTSAACAAARPPLSMAPSMNPGQVVVRPAKPPPMITTSCVVITRPASRGR